MWGVGAECLWATWLDEALGQHDRQQEYVRVGCETGVALLHGNNSSLGLHLRGNNSSLGHPVVQWRIFASWLHHYGQKIEKSGLA